MIIEEKFSRLRTHRNNIDRYRRLLKAELSALERQFIERRLNEEESAMESLATSTITLTFETPKAHYAAASLAEAMEQPLDGDPS